MIGELIAWGITMFAIAMVIIAALIHEETYFFEKLFGKAPLVVYAKEKNYISMYRGMKKIDDRYGFCSQNGDMITNICHIFALNQTAWPCMTNSDIINAIVFLAQYNVWINVHICTDQSSSNKFELDMWGTPEIIRKCYDPYADQHYLNEDDLLKYTESVKTAVNISE